MKISVITPSIRPSYLDITQKCLEAQTFQYFEWLVEIGRPSQGFTLPSDFNKMLRRATGDIVVVLQDCIVIPSDALASIVSLDHANTAYTYAVIKEGKADWRATRLKAIGDDNITPNMWEIDLASAPLSLFKDVGGFDEDFNNGWSWENVEIAWRAAAAHYRFKLSNITEGHAIDHDAKEPHPFRNKVENNDKRANQTRIRAEHGLYKLGFV